MAIGGNSRTTFLPIITVKTNIDKLMLANSVYSKYTSQSFFKKATVKLNLASLPIPNVCRPIQ